MNMCFLSILEGSETSKVNDAVCYAAPSFILVVTRRWIALSNSEWREPTTNDTIQVVPALTSNYSSLSGTLNWSTAILCYWWSTVSKKSLSVGGICS